MSQAPAHQGIDYRARKTHSASTGVTRPRAPDDWYVEPVWAVEALFEAERFVGTIADPACGGGTIVSVARRRGFHAIGGDLVRRWPGCQIVGDFLTSTAWRGAGNIVVNPPFGLAERFLGRALELAHFKVAMLLRLSFLEGVARGRLFDTTPLARVLVFRPRVSMPPGGRDIEATGGAVAFAWFVWHLDHQGPPTIGWLDKPKVAP